MFGVNLFGLFQFKFIWKLCFGWKTLRLISVFFNNNEKTKTHDIFKNLQLTITTMVQKSTAYGLHGVLGKVVLSAVEEVKEKEPEQYT